MTQNKLKKTRFTIISQQIHKEVCTKPMTQTFQTKKNNWRKSEELTKDPQGILFDNLAKTIRKIVKNNFLQNILKIAPM